MFWIKVKAGALQLTLLIIVVVALLLTAFIALIYTHKKFDIQTSLIVKTVKNADEGITYALKNKINIEDTLTIDLKNRSHLKIYRDFWGVLERVTVSSNIKKNKFVKSVLLGSRQKEKERISLYLKDNDNPLVLVGNTKIKGLTYLPKQGVKSGYISGQPYLGSKLIYGEIRTASNLPKLVLETTNQINRIENKTDKMPQKQFLSLIPGKKYINSFFKPAQFIFSNNIIELDTNKLVGHIIIQSTKKVIIKSSTTLKDVVIIAPEVDIKDFVRGRFQVIASRSIEVGENVELNYPSVLVLNTTKNTSVLNKNIKNDIFINNNSIIKGFVVCLGKENPQNYNPQVVLSKNAKILGELYCNLNVELNGVVQGSVYVNNFVLNKSGSVYQNHILNGEINSLKLNEKYVGLPFQNSNKNILKWLY